MLATIGKKIRQARKARGWGLQEFSRRVGISVAQLSKAENGKVALTIPALLKISSALDRPLSYFFQTESEIPRCLGTLVHLSDPEGQAVRYFAEKVKEKTDGHLTIAVFSGSQLGSAIDQVESLITGVIDMFVESLTFYGKYVEAMRVASLPFCFRDEAHYESFLRSALFEEGVRRELRARSVELLNPEWNWKRGPYTVLVARRLVVSPDDLRGVRVRSPESEGLTKFWEQLGAIPVVVPWSEVYGALEQGRFDAILTNLSHVVSMRLTRLARYVTVLGYRPLDVVIAVNGPKYKELPPPLQIALQEAAAEAGKYCTELVERTESEVPMLLEQDGAIVSRVSLRPWRERSTEIIRQVEATGLWERGLFDRIQTV